MKGSRRMRISDWRRRALVAALGASAVVAFAAGCSGGSGGDGATTTPPPTCTPLAAQLSVLQPNVFGVACGITSCHAGALPQNNLDMSSSASVFALGSGHTA